ncbi:hypothetical protein [Ferroacidibacillus organovorans]|uniref:Uncharacterized protein n=1 Tax=Ferroacidibacillus organovorans TaxID=1765683 RepID=A0A162UTS2_9BACL|nr:hypothetical protein [Ferroacidibacillus organovorans]KYP82039.1 hypothetical protein AYJ22_04880 [Ferroacidibacillus organovorans]OAG94359.1 hypothetical protein AYW79_05700 [Ferroacidibacillus organovorans]OPG15244.1 hypothetical protein B2M26_12295 [Ferroacidibacillus organovorans]
MSEFKAAPLESSDLFALHQMEQALSEKLGTPIVLVAYSSSEAKGDRFHLQADYVKQSAYAQHDL